MSFGVDTEAMASAASKIGIAAERIDDILAKIRDDVATMLGGWQSDGATAHEDMHRRFDQDVVTINTNLREMQEALQNTHQLYVQQETLQNSDHVNFRNRIAL